MMSEIKPGMITSPEINRNRKRYFTKLNMAASSNTTVPCQIHCGDCARGKPKQRRVIDNAHRHKQVQQCAGDDDSSEHTNHNTQEEGTGKTKDDACTKVAAKYEQDGT